MIISASRRTDIPAYYSEWFFNRIREGYLYVRNPMNFHKVSKISLSPDVIDAIVFWTKNPLPMLNHLDKIERYPFYFQFTVNSYDTDVEPNVPSKSKVIIPTFKRLSDLIGPQQIIWRYDPIFISPRYTIEYHTTYFEKLAQKFQGLAKRCTISFMDFYPKISKNIKDMEISPFSDDSIITLSQTLVKIAKEYGFTLDTCAEKLDLQKYGISHAHCIDKQLLETLLGFKLIISKDKNQRPECGCFSSIDIGSYNTCMHGCKYCYANFSSKMVRNNHMKHNPDSPLLYGEVGDEDTVSDRKMSSCKECPFFLFPQE